LNDRHFRIKRAALAGLLTIAAGTAGAGEIADAAGEAETLLSVGTPAEAWEEFDRATELFWAEAPLGFRASHLAESVAGFGQFERRETSIFSVGDRLTAYLEPIGYGWTAIGEDFRVRLAVDIEIASVQNGVIAAEADFAVVEHLGQTRSREFQATIAMTIPQLPIGGYELRLTFRDAATGKVASTSIRFEIAD
jgi:hypothetical protein